MMDVELKEGNEYLFCIDGKWRLGKCSDSDEEGIFCFVTDHNIYYYDVECSAIVPLTRAITCVDSST